MFSSCGSASFNIINNSSDTLTLILDNDSDSISYVSSQSGKIIYIKPNMCDSIVTINGEIHFPLPCVVGDRELLIYPSNAFISSTQCCLVPFDGSPPCDIGISFPSDNLILIRKGQIIYHQRRDSLVAELGRYVKDYTNSFWYKHAPSVIKQRPSDKFFRKSIYIEVRDKTVEVK